MSNDRNEVTSATKEAARILHKCLLADSRLDFPPAVLKQASLVNFTPETEPYIPTPMKITESCSALWSCIGMFASAICQERYQIITPDKIEVDMHTASLMLFSLVLIQLSGKGVGDSEVLARAAFLDKGRVGERYRGLATNIYKTADGRYFHLHGSLNTTPVLDMLGLPHHRPDLESLESREVIKDIYREAVGKRNGVELELEANERWRQPGVLCYTAEEFAKTPHGKESIEDPLYSTSVVHPNLPAVAWPTVHNSQRPLSGIKVLDLTKVVAGPTITRVLALLGADVLRVSTDTIGDAGFILFDGQMGKRDTNINLKTAEGRSVFEKLLIDADVLVDGYRPGVLDRLGFGRIWVQETARKRGKGIVYCRENCYGWNGPWSHRAGYQQISDCVSGASWEQGKFLGLDEPVVPLLPNSDYQTGLVGAIAICNALFRRTHHGGSYNVDLSLTQFNNWYLRTLGLQDAKTVQSLRDKHPDFKPRHDTELFELVSLTIKTTMASNGSGPSQLWDPARWTEGPVRWGRDGEMARYLDWSRIVRIISQSSPVDAFGFDFGSCKPGSDPPVWL